MTEKKRKRRSPIGSVVAIMICFSLLLGTTFAWFTDEVNSTKNIIQAGNLDVELVHTNAKGTNETVEEGTPLFLDKNGDPILWEPGVVAWENFTVKNVGSLALWFDLSVLYEDLNCVVVDSAETEYVLSDVLKVAIVEGKEVSGDREAVINSIDDNAWMTLEELAEEKYSDSLEAGKEKSYGTVIWWEQTAADNNWNVNNDKTTKSFGKYDVKDGDDLQINLGIELHATQQPHESDSFDEKYDEDAKPVSPILVNSVATLVAALNNAEEGAVIVLDAAEYGSVAIESELKNVTIQGSEGANVRLNIGSTAILNDVTITDLNVTYVDSSSAYVDGGAINIDAGADVNNLVIENSTFNGTGGRSCVVGCSEPTAEITLSNCVIDGPKYVVYGSAPVAKLTIEDCEIKNISSWVAMLNAGDSVGAKLTISDCDFDKCTGGIAKYLGDSIEEGGYVIFTNNTLTGCKGHDGSDAKWFTLPASAAQITASGNTLDGADWTPGTAQGLGK